MRSMHPVGQRTCCHCKQFFRPDPRQRERHRFCAAPVCQGASKAASQARWLAKPENRDYFCGAENVQRVREWRAKNPDYAQGRKRRPARPAVALQEMMNLQVAGVQEPATRDESPALPEGFPVALQETWRMQPPLLVGLIAHLTGSALQEEMAAVMRRLITRGQALLEFKPEPNLNPKYHDRKTSPLSGTPAAGAAAF